MGDDVPSHRKASRRRRAMCTKIGRRSSKGFSPSFGRNDAHFFLGSDEEHDNVVEAALVQLVARKATALVHAAHVLHEHLVRFKAVRKHATCGGRRTILKRTVVKQTTLGASRQPHGAEHTLCRQQDQSSVQWDFANGW